MCFVGFQVVQRIPVAIKHLHLYWFKFIREGLGHYLYGEGMIRPLDELVDGDRGFASQCLSLFPSSHPPFFPSRSSVCEPSLHGEWCLKNGKS